jgi:hypothetical protein
MCVGSIEEADPKLFFHDIESSWPAIAIVCAVAIVFSYILFIAYRHATKFIVWSFYILTITFSVGMSVFFFVAASKTDSYDNYSNRDRSDNIYGGVIFAILAIVGLVYIIVERHRVKLVIQLFKETSQALINVPTIFIQPFYTFLSIVMTSICFIGVSLVIESSGEFGTSETNRNIVELQQNFVIKAARIFNFIIYIWFIQFILGCQHFIIAR